MPLEPPPRDASNKVVPHDHTGIGPHDGVIRRISEKQIVTDKDGKRGKSRGCQAEAQRRLTSVGKDGMSMQFGTASRDPR